MIDLNPTVGDEMRKQRPAVVMSRDAVGQLKLRVIVPLTGWQPPFDACDWLVRLDPTPGNGLSKTSAADTFQVRSVSARRFVRRVGVLTDDEMARVADGIKFILHL